MGLVRGLEIHSQVSPYRGSIDLFFRFHRGDIGGYGVAQPVVYKVVDESDATQHQPALSLDQKSAQRLMDELWTCGLRPSEGSGSAGSLAATERHLADMKLIAFHALKVKP